MVREEAGVKIRKASIADNAVVEGGGLGASTKVGAIHQTASKELLAVFNCAFWC